MIDRSSPCRLDFEQTWRNQLVTTRAEQELCSSLEERVIELKGTMLEGQVAACVLEFFALHVACKDVGEQVESLMLPLIRERLVAGARQHAADLAERAQQEILDMEEVRHLCHGLQGS